MRPQIKIFSDTDVTVLEQRVNDWLVANPAVDILHLAQTESAKGDGFPFILRISLLYGSPQDTRSLEFQETSNEERLMTPVFFDEQKIERLSRMV